MLQDWARAAFIGAPGKGLRLYNNQNQAGKLTAKWQLKR